MIRGALNSAGYDIVRYKKPAARVGDEHNYRRWYGDAAVDSSAFYNVGSGGFRHPQWTNVDRVSEWYGDVQGQVVDHDLESDDPLPIKTGTAAIVYTSHTIEHISNKAAAKLFREARRVLRKGGVFRATTPDVKLDYQAWRRGDHDYYYWMATERHPDKWKDFYTSDPFNFSIGQKFLSHVAPYLTVAHLHGPKERISDAELQRLFDSEPMEKVLDGLISRIDPAVHKRFPGQHCNWWSAEKLIGMLREAGFETAYQSGYGQSATPALRDTQKFDSTHPRISLHVEAIAGAPRS
jgi:SAM-dependent methyltransferase